MSIGMCFFIAVIVVYISQQEPEDRKETERKAELTRKRLYTEYYKKHGIEKEGE